MLIAGSQGWQAPRIVAAFDGVSCQNPVLWYQNSTGLLNLLFTKQLSSEGQGTSTLMHGSTSLESMQEGLSFEPLSDVPGQPGAQSFC